MKFIVAKSDVFKLRKPFRRLYFGGVKIDNFGKARGGSGCVSWDVQLPVRKFDAGWGRRGSCSRLPRLYLLLTILSLHYHTIVLMNYNLFL